MPETKILSFSDGYVNGKSDKSPQRPAVCLHTDDGIVRPLRDVEADAIKNAIATSRTVAQCAVLLGIGRSTLYRKARLYDIALEPGKKPQYAT